MSEYADVRKRQLLRLGVDEEPTLRATKYLLAQIDPAEVLRWRTRQKMELGRYGRQSVLQWDDVPLVEFLRYHSALIRVLEDENRESHSIPGAEDYR